MLLSGMVVGGLIPCLLETALTGVSQYYNAVSTLCQAGLGNSVSSGLSPLLRTSVSGLPSSGMLVLLFARLVSGMAPTVGLPLSQESDPWHWDTGSALYKAGLRDHTS